MNSESKNHWETVYETKSPNEVSWTQEVPTTSLDFIRGFNLPKTASIIDVGGGDSKLVDFLLEEGYENITVLDISAKALEKAQLRLGEKSKKVTWIVSDICDFDPKTKFDLWHDRAAFHFLTSEEQIKKYATLVKNNVTDYLTIGTFSKDGPKKCSGLEIKQYDKDSIVTLFEEAFQNINCITENHTTPFETVQNFIFCSFNKL